MSPANSGISSPCINNCQLDAQRICKGCYRSNREISQWWDCDDNTKRQILKNEAQRKESR